MKSILIRTLLVLILAVALKANDSLNLEMLDGEYWWGAVVDDGYIMPFSQNSSYSHDLDRTNKSNQIQPLLVSNKGRYIWCEDPFQLEIKDGNITIHSSYGAIKSGIHGTSLQTAYNYVSTTFFPASGKRPADLLFTHPQYNTWIELNYNHNQENILKYAQNIVKHHMPPGVFMIDESWQTYYGQWTFNTARFDNPKAMITDLHDMGFKVMLWLVPFVSPDSPVFRDLRDKDFFVKDNQYQPAIIKWWNGYSAVLDFTNPQVNDWFQSQLDILTSEYKVDGFKLDGGDTGFYTGDLVSFDAKYANSHTEAWAKFGLLYPYNEYRACWKMGGRELAQRLHDKNHEWDDLKTLIPNIVLQGLLGYAFVCPDMIGGGDYLVSFKNLQRLDEELVVRSAQCQALMPMMQFSLAPWRVLSENNLNICREMANLHVDFGPLILDLADYSAKTGEPIVRHMAYEFPDMKYETINDQFLLGKDILVAPVLEKGARSRVVHFPPGVWQDTDGENYTGPITQQVSAPLEKLPWFKRIRK
jgi:alpha-glucosidase (family GH31 glycosyl hydrolase)